MGRILLDETSRHLDDWIWLVCQCGLIIAVIDGIGTNRVVQVSNATLIGRR